MAVATFSGNVVVKRNAPIKSNKMDFNAPGYVKISKFSVSARKYAHKERLHILFFLAPMAYLH